MSEYRDIVGNKYHRRFVVVNEMEDTIIACGIYEDYYTAVGYVMTSIWEFADSYKNDGDVFEIGNLEDGENGDFIRIRFKSHHWDHFCEEYYHILFCDDLIERKRRKKDGEADAAD